MKKFYLFFIMQILLLIFFISPCLASSNVLFILDCSNSMWGQVDNVAKITTAKQVLSNLVKNLPADTNVGLMTYGHRSEKNCKDVETLISIGPNDPKKFSNQIQNLKPKGMTPLTYSLEQSLPLFASFKEQENSVVLVSDGKETCDGDPCGAAKNLTAAGVNLKVHVVGFDVSAEERKQLECIAQEGKGRYFDAQNTKGFQEAIVRVGDVVAKPPEQKKTALYFSDDFDGDALKKDWEVLRENNNNKALEDGVLTIISDSGTLNGDTLKNVLLCKRELPEKCEIITKYKTEIKDFNSGWGKSQWAGLLLYGDKDNYLSLVSAGRDYAGNGYLAIEFNKFSGGQPSPVHALDRPQVSTPDSPWTFILKVVKDGYKYTAFYGFEGKTGIEWKEIGTHPMLGKKLYAGLVSFNSPGMKEAVTEFDNFKINEIK